MYENSILQELVYTPKEGSIRFKEVRYLLIRPETLATIHKTLESEVGPESAGEMLYAGGFTGGNLSGRKYKQAFGYTDHQIVEFMCGMGTEIGWGYFRLLALDSEEGCLIVEVENSPFAASYGVETGIAACHLIRGVLGGLGDAIFGGPVSAQETQCLAEGNAYCRFEVRRNP